MVSIADKVDSLVGLFAAGCAPTASADPYGLRRAALGLLQTLTDNSVRTSVSTLVAAAAKAQPVKVTAETEAEVCAFVGKRLEQMLIDRGLGVAPVRAILAEQGDDPAGAARAAAELDATMGREESTLAAAMEALSRPTRLTRGKEGAAVAVSESLFEQEEERALFGALLAARDGVSPGMDVEEFLRIVSSLRDPVAAFMDGVFVMAEDEKVRANRLALLRDVASLQKGVVDMSQLPGF